MRRSAHRSLAWEELLGADPDAFLLPAESTVIDPTLFWYVHDLKSAVDGSGYGSAETVVYDGLGSIKFEEFKTGILFVYSELNIEWDGLEIDSNVMFEGARENFQRILEGKIKLGFEYRALEEIENQLKWVNSKKAAALMGLVTKYREAFGLESLAKKVDAAIAQKTRRKSINQK